MPVEYTIVYLLLQQFPDATIAHRAKIKALRKNNSQPKNDSTIDNNDKLHGRIIALRRVQSHSARGRCAIFTCHLTRRFARATSKKQRTKNISKLNKTTTVLVIDNKAPLGALQAG